MYSESLFADNFTQESPVIFSYTDLNNINVVSPQIITTYGDTQVIPDIAMIQSSWESWLIADAHNANNIEMATNFGDVNKISPELDTLTGTQLRTASANKDPGNTSKTATVVKLTSKPLVKNETIGFTGDTDDYYKFTLKQKQDFQLTLDGLDQNADVRLLESNGKSVIVQSANPGKEKEVIDKTLPAGTYFVQVYPDKDAQTKYKLSMSASTIIEDADGKIGGAKDLGQITAKGKPWKGDIGIQESNQRDVNDYYRFQLIGANNQLNVVLEGLKGDANIELLGSDGKEILGSGNTKGNKSEKIDQSLEAGTYYLRVFPQGTAKTNYNLKVTADAIADPDGKLELANNLGKLPSKNLKKVSDIGFERSGVRDSKDYYQFEVTKESDVNIVLDGLKQDANLKLLDKGGNILFSSSELNQKGEVVDSILPKGTYYVLVEPKGDGRTAYNLSVSGDSKFKEKDDQLPGKPLSKVQTGEIGFGKGTQLDQSDYYNFELKKESEVTITLDGLAKSANIELYDSDGTSKILSSADQKEKNKNLNSILDEGKYYVRVKSKDGPTKYKLSLDIDAKIREADDQLPGESLGELTEKTITKSNKIGFGTQSTRDLNDYYNFVVGEKSNVNINLDGLSASTTFNLLNTDGQILETKTTKKADSLSQNLEPGKYYLQVEAGKAGSNYKLGISAQKSEDDYGTIKTAKVLGELNQQDQLLEKNQIGFEQGGLRDQSDYYIFTLTESSDFNLILDNLKADANVQLLGSDGKKVVLENFQKGNKPEELNSKKLAAGTYYVRVFPVGDAKTSYDLKLGTSQKSTDVSSFKLNPVDSENWVAGEKVDINYQVSNNGDNAVADLKVSFYLSSDANIDTSDRLLDTATIKSLGNGKNTALTKKQLTLPNTTDSFWNNSGEYYLGMMVDPDNKLKEDNESNNVISSIVNIQLPTDLSGEMTTITPSVRLPGTKIPVNYTISNSTGNKADSFRVGFYLSTDTKIDPYLDRFLGSKQIKSLAGKSNTGQLTTEITLPDSNDYFWNGVTDYYLGMIVDDQEVISESKEKNNATNQMLSLGEVPLDQAGNTLEVARTVGLVNSTAQNFSDWVGSYYGISTDESDYYQIDITEKSELKLDLTGLSSNANLYLYNSNNSIISSSELDGNQNDSISYKVLPGKYYVLVSSNYGANTQYNLAMSATPLSYPVPVITGNTFETALNINVNNSTQTFQEYVGNPFGVEADKTDYYKLTISNDATLELNLTGLTANANLYLDDLNSYYNIASSEKLQTADETITKNLTPGTYYVRVESVGDAKTTYDLQVTGKTIPNNQAGNDPDLSLDLGIMTNTPVQVNDWVGDIDNTDYYKITLSQSGLLNLNLTGDASLSLYNDNNQQIDWSQGLLAGNYYVQISGYYGNTNYSLQASVTNIPADNAGNTFDQAKDLGTITTATESDWVWQQDTYDAYKFTLANPGTTNIELNGLQGNANIYLYNSDVTDTYQYLAYSANDGIANEKITQNLQAGTYYVGVDNYYGYATPYTLSLSHATIPDNAGDDLATAKDLGAISQTPATLSDWIGAIDTQDWVKFTLTEDTSINLQLGGITSDTNLYLYDANNSSIGSVYTYANDTGIIQQNLVAGTYYVLVEKTYYGDTNYNLQVSGTAIPDKGPDAQATALDLGAISQTPATLDDWVGNVDTQDWAKFTLTEDTNINLQLGGITSDTNLYLYDANNSSIGSVYTYANDTGIIQQNLVAGTYYVLVERSAGDTNYNLQVSGTAIPDNGPDTQATALDLGAISQTPTTLSDWVGGIDTQDWAKFTLTEDTSINLQLGGITSGSGASLLLYDANNSSINFGTTIQQNLAAGTYYVLVEKPYYDYEDTNYNLQVSGTAIPDNGPDTQATALDLGDITQTQTFSDSVSNIDEDWVKFSLTEDTSVNLQLEAMSGFSGLSLYDANTILLGSATAYDSFEIGTIQQELTAGTYYVVVNIKDLGESASFNLQVSGTPISGGY